jgi:hypothetical protein
VVAGGWLGGDGFAGPEAETTHGGGLTGPFGTASTKLAVFWIETFGTRAAAGSDCAGYVAVTVAVEPAAPP